ncbi:hypothetical protein LEP3755_22050 [Leptolyngbya sp. NIES-3755]|nr:hypothetical protein LEP3755_22050 [Leptolyngbya sp. NIES-3755]
MDKNQQIQPSSISEDSSSNPVELFVTLLISGFIGFLGLGLILAESFTKLNCQRDSLNSGSCQIIRVGFFGQSTKQNVLLREIRNVTSEQPIESEWFNLLITQTEEEIKLNGFNPEQAATIQSFLKDPSQKDLVLQQPYNRQPYALFIAGSFLLVGACSSVATIRKIIDNRNQ